MLTGMKSEMVKPQDDTQGAMHKKLHEEAAER